MVSKRIAFTFVGEQTQRLLQEVRKLVNRRIETGYSTSSELELEEHLAQLKMLFQNIDRFKYSGGVGAVFQESFKLAIAGQPVENENYSQEDYEKFIARMIGKKKERVEKVLDIL